MRFGDLGTCKMLPNTGVWRVRFNSLQLATGRYLLSVSFSGEGYDMPYTRGQYGYLEVINDIPTMTPGEDAAICWPPVNWSLESGPGAAERE